MVVVVLVMLMVSDTVIERRYPGTTHLDSEQDDGDSSERHIHRDGQRCDDRVCFSLSVLFIWGG